MPLYEYRCNQCQKRITLLVRREDADLACPQCGGVSLSRLFSTFSVRHTYMDDYESILNDPRLVSGLEGNDPRALAEWNRRMSRGMDEDLEPEHKEMLDRMEKGEMPAESLMPGAPTQPASPEG